MIYTTLQVSYGCVTPVFIDLVLVIAKEIPMTGSEPMNLRSDPALTSSTVCSFTSILLCPGTH